MNLEDVAQRAGVSTATVSRVLNDIGVVKNTTRDRVLEAVAQLKYSPNLHARALAGAGKTIGLIVSNLENPFFLDIFHHLDLGANLHGYEVLISNTGYDQSRLERAVNMMLGRRPSGLALVVSEMDHVMLDELSARGVRTVAYDAVGSRPGITNIRTNYRVGMQRLAEYLYSLGHRKMAYVGHHPALGPLQDRRQAFEEVLSAYAPEVEFQMVANDDSFAGGKSAARELFDTGFRPSAILCVNDYMALGVLRELREMGLAVPEDVSVSGFDNISLAAVVSPALTTAHIPREQIGRQILEHLILDAKDLSGGDIVMEPELIIRESTGPARSAV